MTPKTKIYLAIPYGGMAESSFEQATIAAALLMKEGYNVLSPITHSHPFTKLPDDLKLPGHWDYWEQIDYQYLDWADELYVIIPWEIATDPERLEKSVGVQAEIAYALGNLMPVTYINLHRHNNKSYFTRIKNDNGSTT